VAYTKLKTRRKVVAKVRDNKPKVKCKSASKKRFHLTGTGKVVATQANKRHNMRKRSRRQLNNQTGCVVLENHVARVILRYHHLTN